MVLWHLKGTQLCRLKDNGSQTLFLCIFLNFTVCYESIFHVYVIEINGSVTVKGYN